MVESETRTEFNFSDIEILTQENFLKIENAFEGIQTGFIRISEAQITLGVPRIIALEWIENTLNKSEMREEKLKAKMNIKKERV